MHLFAIVALLIGVAEPRSVQLDLLSLVKNVALNSENAGANDNGLQNFQRGDADKIKNGKNSKVGFILFGNLEDLEKYRIDLDDDNVDNGKAMSDIILQSEYEVKNRANDASMMNPDISETKEEHGENAQEKESNEKGEEEKEKQSDRFISEYLENYEENEESEDYEIVDEPESQDSTRVEIFSEDEYDDYDDKDNAAQMVSSEEDESEEERFYDEDEKYYEDENNKFKKNEEEDGIFM